MAEQSTGDDQGGISEALRTAIERTFASTAGSAADTRERAGELLDEVAKRGQDARAVAGRVIEAIQGMRLATRDDLVALREEIVSLQSRVAELEQRAGGGRR